MLEKGKLLTWIAVALFASTACSSDSDDGGGGQTTCAQNPWSCSGATTCWADAQGAFGCLPAGTKQKGEACMPVGGQADCGSALFCFQNIANPGAGASCVSFCDGAHPCGANETCAPVAIQQTNTTVTLCISQLPGTGGTSGAGGSAGTAGAAGVGASPPVDGG